MDGSHRLAIVTRGHCHGPGLNGQTSEAGLDGLCGCVAKGHELAGQIPGARLTLVSGAGHLVQEDALAELTAAVLTFLA